MDEKQITARVLYVEQKFVVSLLTKCFRNEMIKKRIKHTRGLLTSDALVATELMLGDIADSGLAFNPKPLFLYDE